MSGSAFADAIDGLIAIYASAVPAFTGVAPADVKVIDGEPQDPPRKFICVGWNAEGPAASAALSPANLSYGAAENAFEIACMLSYWDGSKAAQLSVVRRAAVELFNTFDAALAVDRTLGGAAIGDAAASVAQYVPDLSREGALVELHWTVSGTAQA